MNYQLELITYLNKIYDKKIQDILQKENLNKLMKLNLNEVKSLVKSNEVFLGSDLDEFIINLIPCNFEGFLLREAISKAHNATYPILYNKMGEPLKNYTHNNFALTLWEEFTNKNFIDDLRESFSQESFNNYVNENLDTVYDELINNIKIFKSENNITIPYNNNLVDTVKEMILNNKLSFSYALSLIDMDALRQEMSNVSVDLNFYDEFDKLEDDLEECLNKFFKFNHEELSDFLINKENFILFKDKLIKEI